VLLVKVLLFTHGKFKMNLVDSVVNHLQFFLVHLQKHQQDYSTRMILEQMTEQMTEQVTEQMMVQMTLKKKKNQNQPLLI